MAGKRHFKSACDIMHRLEGMSAKSYATPNRGGACLRIEAETDYQRAPPANYEGPEMKYRFGRAKEKKLGIKVFGPHGF
jgi:hypothetical protein